MYKTLKIEIHRKQSQLKKKKKKREKNLQSGNFFDVLLRNYVDLLFLILIIPSEIKYTNSIQ